MEMWIVWIIVLAVLLTIEVLSMMMWALCVAVGCIGGLVASLLGADLLWQVIVMAISSVVAYIVLVPMVQKWHFLNIDRKGRESRTGMDALLGRHAFIEQEIRPDRLGRARIDGDNWQVRCSADYGTISRGTEVVVTGYDSIILDVVPYTPES